MKRFICVLLIGVTIISLVSVSSKSMTQSKLNLKKFKWDSLLFFKSTDKETPKEEKVVVTDDTKPLILTNEEYTNLMNPSQRTLQLDAPKGDAEVKSITGGKYAAGVDSHQKDQHEHETEDNNCSTCAKCKSKEELKKCCRLRSCKLIKKTICRKRCCKKCEDVCRETLDCGDACRDVTEVAGSTKGLGGNTTGNNAETKEVHAGNHHAHIQLNDKLTETPITPVSPDTPATVTTPPTPSKKKTNAFINPAASKNNKYEHKKKVGIIKKNGSLSHPSKKGLGKTNEQNATTNTASTTPKDATDPSSVGTKKETSPSATEGKTVTIPTGTSTPAPSGSPPSGSPTSGSPPSGSPPSGSPPSGKSPTTAQNEHKLESLISIGSKLFLS